MSFSKEDRKDAWTEIRNAKVQKNIYAQAGCLYSLIFHIICSDNACHTGCRTGKKSGNYRSLRAHDVPPAALWTDKIAAMSIHSLFSTLVLTISAVMADVLSGSGSVPVGQIIAAGALCWITSLVLIPLQLWAATKGGIFLSIGIGFAGMAAGILAAPHPYWIAVPWSWATRLSCPVIGVHPNGMVLESVCSAFSEMKEELKSSLSAQWYMEQERVIMTEALAHDLKSPLSVILAYTDALLDSTCDDSEKWHRYLSVIKANTEKSASLIQRMQDAADLERPDIQPRPAVIDIRELLSQKVQDYRLQSSCKDIELYTPRQHDYDGCIA